MKSPSIPGDERVPVPVFRKGLGLKHAVADTLAQDYHSQLVDEIRRARFRWGHGRLVVYLAKEFGFCYGVDRAVDYAYQTRARFPDRRVFLTGEIIHNPQVNTRLREAGIEFLSDSDRAVHALDRDDVVIIPAFGVTVTELLALERRGCTLVDTTCGSVLNVWKSVRQYTKAGFTALIHGKVHHEETRATASQALSAPGGHYLIVLDREEARLVCEFIRQRIDASVFERAFGGAYSPGFDPTRDLQRVGLANQTTMLMSESLEIGEMIRDALIDRYGIEALPEHYQAFETICSATQDRQDAIQDLLATHSFDLAVVIGGYNSSNTRNLARICSTSVPAFHIADASCLVSADEIHHRSTEAPASAPHDDLLTTRGWFPASGRVTVAVTAGASTPDSIVGAVVRRLGSFAEG